jgi:hypothetical protein
MSVNRGALWAVLGAVAAVVAASCSDSLHLDPEPNPSGGAGGSDATSTGGGSTTTTTTTTGGDGGGATTTAATTGTGGSGECQSNSDCPVNPADPAQANRSICDTVYAKCVECLEYQDCAFEPGTVCIQGQCQCPAPADAFCDGQCVDTDASLEHCGKCGHACFATCIDGECKDAWEPTSVDGAPIARAQHVAVWTEANQMIVWGGVTTTGYTSSGGIYDPATGAWKPMSTENAPSPRAGATAVWSDTQDRMLVFGGVDESGALATGGAFDPVANTWEALPSSGAPTARAWHSAIWTGTRMLVWGGAGSGQSPVWNDGALYNPELKTWTAVSTTFPDNVTPVQARYGHSAIWAGAVMVVYGGLDGSGHLSGGTIFDPAGFWDAPAGLAPGAPFEPGARAFHTAVWTGATMIVWGGYDGSYRKDGAKSDLTSWTSMPAAPIAGRRYHTAVWIAGNVNRMIVWGGADASGYLDDGAMFDPAADPSVAWNASPMPKGPEARQRHTAVVTNTGKMLVWGGQTPSGYTNTGAILDPELAP